MDSSKTLDWALVRYKTATSPYSYPVLDKLNISSATNFASSKPFLDFLIFILSPLLFSVQRLSTGWDEFFDITEFADSKILCVDL